ncbi:GNAT family protein [Nonomuraea sp. NPDC003709]|uniref:GNAT family N-acetyltransferase n=1 Tax=Nonomuraea sp. NPDC003709 TaxID=3154450 RepID=UPI0033AB0986
MTYLAQGARVGIRRIGHRDRTEFLALNRESADLLARWMPGAPITTDEAFDGYMARFDDPANEGFVICRVDTGAIVGRANLNNIIRGTRQDGTLGYCAYSSTTGRGYMTEGLRLLVRYAFGELGLHRVEANIQPSNTPSLNLIKRAGFRREGYSPDFQFIDGAWRDHERWAVTAGTGPGGA